MEIMAIVAAADGSSLGNPGPTGWAWYVDENTWQAGGSKHGTNNIGELTAVLELFRATKHVADEPLEILCDSQYVINCVTKWMPGWKKRGWVKADKKPVMNSDLLKQIDAELVGRNYRFEWVRGHAGHGLNEAADDRARAAATAYQRGETPDEGPGFPYDDAASPQDSTGKNTGVNIQDEPLDRQSNERLEIRPDEKLGEQYGERRNEKVSAQQSEGLDERLDGQLDLLSLLSEDDPEETAAATSGSDDVEAVWKLEAELLKAYAEAAERHEDPDIVHLLDEMFTGVRADGYLVEENSVPMTHVHGTTMERLGATELTPDLIRLTYVLDARRDSNYSELVLGSVWLRRGKSWKLSFRQETGRN
ncbi:ribonuclease HI family protein [Neomicrococcus aestuarii]